MSHKILVTGATGTIGKALVKSLTGKGASVVAAVRDTEKAATLLPEGTELVKFDFADPSTFAAATQGVDRVFLLGPPLVLNLEELLTPFIDHLKQQQIKRVVYLGALGLDLLPEMPFHTRLINRLTADGFELTVLKPSFFAQNFKNYEWDNITQRQITFVVAGNGKVGFIDAHDIAAAAAAVLTTDGHAGHSYELTGPETLSYADAAAILSEVTGKTIVYPNPDAETYIQVLKSAGAPDFVAPYMIRVYSLIADNKVNFVNNTVEELTGRKPASLREVLTRDFASN
ncbi:MAG: SDR family oxidoreductase [Bacteroidia bacterium]|jgi:uncharacterized protein YbjT (DUF2867 family)|nr:SDR family oxidoreductase [Bacteroidia bacterium]